MSTRDRHAGREEGVRRTNGAAENIHLATAQRMRMRLQADADKRTTDDGWEVTRYY